MDNRIMNQEYLSNDIFEKEFLKIFSYFHHLQYFLGSCRVHVKNRFITPPSRFQKIYTIFALLVSLGSTIYMIRLIFDLTIGRATITKIRISLLLTNCFTHSCNMIHVRYFNGRKNVLFHVRMQQLDRTMKIKYNEKLNAYLIRSNNVCVVLICLVYSAINLQSSVRDEFSRALSYIGLRFNAMAYMTELLSCTSIIAFFTLRIRYINTIIRSYLKRNEHLMVPRILVQSDEHALQIIGRESYDEFIDNDIRVYLKEMFHCFSMFQDLYRFQIFTFCIKILFVSVVTFQITIQIIKEAVHGLHESYVLIVLTITDFLMAIFLAYRYETFMGEVKQTKRLCIKVMALHQNGPMWEKAKNVLSIIEETPPKFSVYDLWDLNAGLFVSVFSLTTSLIVTLLQFEYL